MFFAYIRNSAVVLFLLSFLVLVVSCDINTAKALGSNKLFKAISDNNINILEKELKSGANPNSKNAMGLSCIYYATSSNSLPAIKLLLKYGADINGKGLPPLDIAILQKNYKLIEFLLQNKADLLYKPPEGNNALIKACGRHGDVKTLTILLKYGGKKYIERKNINGVNPLIQAVICKQYDCIELLLKNGSDKEVFDLSGNPLTTVAIIEGDKKGVATLLKNGVDVNLTGSDNITPLMTAVMRGENEIVEYLHLHDNAYLSPQSSLRILIVGRSCILR